MTPKDALAQNPASPAPQDVLDALRVVEVEHYGFDGQIHRGQIVVHQMVVADVERFFARARELEFPIEKVIPICHPQYQWDDMRSCGDNNSSGFNYRLVSGSTTRLSNHARGLAFDINPVQNIYIRYDDHMNEVFRFPAGASYDPAAPGTLTTDHPLVNLMRELGWKWGGDWTSPKDWQHFEKPI